MELFRPYLYMQNNIVIRQAKQSDLPILLLFEQEIIRAERPFDRSIKEGDDVHYYDLEMMLTQPEVRIAVAEIDEEIVASGYARIEKAKPYLKHSHHAYLGFMFVRQERRGQGINQMIIEYLANFAKANNITELRLDVFAGNENAVHAYEKAGFKKLLIEMEKQV